jgi:two-component system, cell cycle sensor histidine kinase and response regulator CckA
MLRNASSARPWNVGTRLGGAAVALIGAVALVGWFTGSRTLNAVSATYVPTAPNTAALFLLLGVSLVILTAPFLHAPFVARCVVALSFVATALHLAEWVMGADLGIDHAVFSFPSERVGLAPVGRMAFFTALSFGLACPALFVQSLHRRSRFAGNIAGMLGLVVTLIGSVFSLGYLYHAPLLYGDARIPMALPSAIAFVVLGLSISVPAALRDQAEQRERERDRAHIDGAFEHAALGMALVAPDGRWLRVNRALCEIVGYSERELLATTFQAITHPDDVDADVSSVHRMLAGEIKTYQREKRYFHGDGHVIWVLLSVSLSRDADGTPRYFISQVQDITERKRADTELTRQALVFETIGDAVIVMDLTGRVVDWNPAASRLFGYTRAEIVGRPVVTVHDPSLAGLLEEQIQASLHSHHRWSGEMPFRRKDGSQGLADVVVVAQLDRAGQPVAWIGVNREVTERRRAEAALAESRALLAAAEELAHVGSWSLDTQTGALTWSDELFRIVGREPASAPLSTEWFVELVHPDDRPAVRGAFKQLIEEGDAAPVECRVIRPDGSIRTIQARGRLQRNAGGAGQRVLGSAQDVTERVEAERALRMAHATVAALLDAAPLAILSLDLDSCVTMWNPGAERLFGWTAAEVIGKPLPVVSIEYLPEYTQLRDEVFRGRRVSGYETKRRRKDGSLVDVLLSTAPLQDGAGNVSGLVALLVDVTERRGLEEQLRQSQRLEAVGQLAGGIAHDFNNLLTVVTSYAALLLEDLGPSHPKANDIQEIARAADRAAALTQQLLAFGRRQLLQPRVLDVNHTVTELERMLRRLLTADIELVTVLDPELRCVRADPGQLEQVLMNLVVNARDAMPGGGTLTVETANVEIDASYPGRHASAIRPGGYVRIAVSDTGHGMDEATQARIFEPFFTTKEPGKGTGLGLSTVYGIVNQSGGYVWCYSEPGRGTTFKIYLPHADAQAEQRGNGTARVAARRGMESVLIVEDDDAVRSVARRILASHGYAVLEAAGGAAALRLYDETSPPVDLVLTDVVMPEMSGSEMARQLRERHPGIRVLFMSGYTGEAALRQRVLEPGAAFIEKPFAPEVLAARVREMLDQPAADTLSLRSN